MSTRVGVVSDTHGLVRPEALDALRDVEFIVHAGDVGKPEVLESLRAVAPVSAVRGNVDTGDWAAALPENEVVEIESASLYLLHDLAALDLDPAAAEFHAVITGHSHQPALEQRGGVLFLNPGSIGPRRFRLPISMALLTVDGEHVSAELLELEPGA